VNREEEKRAALDDARQLSPLRRGEETIPLAKRIPMEEKCLLEGKKASKNLCLQGTPSPEKKKKKRREEKQPPGKKRQLDVGHHSEPVK